jgi:beta-mannosidase
MDFGGKVLAEEKQYISIDPLASKVYLDWPLKKLTDAGGADTARVFVVADLQIGGATDYAMNGKEISRSIIYLTPVKQIQLKPATLRVETTGEKGNYKVSISSPVLARDVYLSFGNLDVKVSDNYFDLLPGETSEITATSAAALADLKLQMKVISLTDAFGPQPGQAVVSAAK